MKLARKNIDDDAEKSRLSASERQSVISGMLIKAGYISISELGKNLGVSEMTIRRDLDLLASHGEVTRTYGGAISLKGSRPRNVDLVEPVIDERILRNNEAKARIGRLAASLISPGQTIAVDIGSTTLCLAQALTNLNVQVFTNSLKVAQLLSSSVPRVYMPGGEIRGSEPSIIGSIAREQLERLRFDIAFIGAASITNDGIYDYSLEDTEIKQSLIARSNMNVALMDSSKFDRMSVVKIADLQALDILITDKLPNDEFGTFLDAAGIEVLVANED